MAQQHPARQPEDLKNKLVRRLAVAGVLIALLLGGLALFDDPTTLQPARPAVRVSTAPPPVARPPEPVKLREKPAEEKKEGPKPVPGDIEGAGPEKTATPPAPAPPLSRGYVLQLGVFNNTANAEELHARLERSGIASTIEARVQLGPFKTRQEAEQA